MTPSMRPSGLSVRHDGRPWREGGLILQDSRKDPLPGGVGGFQPPSCSWTGPMAPRGARENHGLGGKERGLGVTRVDMG